MIIKVTNMIKKLFTRRLCLLITILLANTYIYAQTYKTVAEVKGLPVGSKVSKFTATDQNGKTFDLSKAIKKGPVVLLFYRGQWCPVCNRHLSNLQDSLSQIYAKGATVIAVSPEKQEYLEKTASKTKATFTLLHDRSYRISEAFDVVFKPTGKEISLYNERLKANIDNAHSDNSQRLPVPATFIINRKGIIVWRHFNSDYRVRASVKEILDHIPAK